MCDQVDLVLRGFLGHYVGLVTTMVFLFSKSTLTEKWDVVYYSVCVRHVYFLLRLLFLKI